MKILIVSVVLLFVTARATIDYSTQSSFDTAACGLDSVARPQSPILIEKTLCGPYGTFKLTMDDITATPTFDGTSGAYSVPYTGASLTYNKTMYNSANILLRIKAENQLFEESNQADAELQILMGETTDTPNAVFSILLKVAADDDTAAQNAKTSLDIISSLTATTDGWDFKFSTLAARITEKINNDQFLNIFRYEGTLTIPPTCDPAVWFIYGSAIYIQQSDLTTITGTMATDATAQDVTLRAGQNSRTVFSSTAVPNGGGGGPISVERLCFSGYFENHMGDNYGLWFGVVIILLFFISTLTMSDIPITDPDYKETCKTIHPLYSIWTVGNEIFTKKSRSALVLMTITIHALFSSAWYRNSYPKLAGSYIIVYAIYSMLISWAYNYALGNILRSYYDAKYHYCKSRDETWDQKAQNRIFAYYAAVFATICIAWPFTVWNMGEIRPQDSNETSNYWVATFFVGLGLEFLAADIIIALLSKSSMLCRNFIRRKGYMYDDLCHQTYLDSIKMD